MTPRQRTAIAGEADDLREARDARAESFVRDAHGGSTVVVRAEGEVDLSTAPDLERRLRSALTARPGRLVVDLSGVWFLSAAGYDAIRRAMLFRSVVTRVELLLSANARRVLAMCAAYDHAHEVSLTQEE